MAKLVRTAIGWLGELAVDQTNVIHGGADCRYPIHDQADVLRGALRGFRAAA